VALAADERLDGCVVAVAEHGVLVEHDDLLARALEERVDRVHVLQRLPPGTERVLVDARERVGGRGARDEEDVVDAGLAGDLCRDTRRGAAGEDLVPLADQVLRRVDTRCRVGLVVDEGEVDRLAVDLVRALGRVAEAELEAFDVLRPVGREQAGARVDDADVVRGGRLARPRRDRRRPREHGEGHQPEQDVGEAMAHERILPWCDVTPEPETRFRCEFSPYGYDVSSPY
jgi:hypothetical protein